MPIVSFRRLGAVAGLSILAAGCARLPGNFQDPDLQLNQVIIRGLGFQGGNLDLVVRVYNPNQFALRGTRVDAGFNVQGSHVADITYLDEFQVQQGDTAMITLPVRFQWSGVSGALRSALSYGDLPYQLKGRVTVRLPGGQQVVVPFEREGRAPLTRGTGVPLMAAPPS